MRKGRIHIPLPDARARKRLLEIRMHKMEPPPELADEEMEELVRKTEGFSGSDLAVLISDAIMGPVRVPPAIPALQRRKLMLPHAVAGLLARASSLVPECAPCAMLMPRVSPPRFKRASPPASLSLSPGASGSLPLSLAWRLRQPRPRSRPHLTLFGVSEVRCASARTPWRFGSSWSRMATGWKRRS